MERMKEYQMLMAELDRPVPGLDHTLERARRRDRKNRLVLRPLAGISAVFAVFVLLVNFCAPVAYACSQIPGLRELAAAVTFSRSLSDAVENDYVQELHLSQTESGITVDVDYLIVDQKQVNVFFRVTDELERDFGLHSAYLVDSGNEHGYSSSLRYPQDEEELYCSTVDFIGEDRVPDSMNLVLEVMEREDGGEILASFDFLLEFDPLFTAAGKTYPVDQRVILDGQVFTIRQIQVYPTHLRVDVEDDPANTTWLKSLEFYIETEDGKFEPVSNGILAVGGEGTESMVSFRADSTYFYDAIELKVVITGAKFREKGQEKIWVDLTTGETGDLPEGVEYHSFAVEDGEPILRFRVKSLEEDHHHQVFEWTFFDETGEEYSMGGRGSVLDHENECFFIEELYLTEFEGEKIWLEPSYSRFWTAEQPITIPVY